MLLSLLKVDGVLNMRHLDQSQDEVAQGYAAVNQGNTDPKHTFSFVRIEGASIVVVGTNPKDQAETNKLEEQDFYKQLMKVLNHISILGTLHKVWPVPSVDSNAIT